MATDSVTKVLEGYGVHAGADSIHLDMVPAELVEEALAHHEGKLASTAPSWSKPANTPAAAPRIASWWTPPTCTTPSPGAT